MQLARFFICNIITLLLFLISPVAEAQTTIYRSEEQALKKAALSFFDDYTVFINQLGNGNIRVEEKKALIEEFLPLFFSKNANVEQDLRAEGKGRVVRIKSAGVYLNNLGVYYQNIATTHSNVVISNVCRDENGQLFFVVGFDRTFEAIDRNDAFINSTTLRRDLYLNINLRDTLEKTTFAIRSIAFSEPKDLEELEVDILPDPRYINVITPSNNSSYVSGEAMNITWQSNITGNVRVELYRSGNPEKIINSNTANTGSIYGQRLNLALPYDTAYQIKISSIIDAKVYDFSETFTIGTERQRQRIKKEGESSMMIGFKGGMNLSYIGDTGFSYDLLKTGGLVGLISSFPIKPGLAIRSGVNLSERGAKIDKGNDRIDYLHIQYFEVPVFMDFYFNTWDKSSFKYFMGLQYSFRRQATYTTDAADSFVYFQRGEEEVTTDINSGELSLNLGLGYEVLVASKTKLFFDVQYLYGLSTLNSVAIPSIGLNRANMFNRSFTASMGVLILVDK